MRVFVVHNRYRSVAASGENAVVETEAALLRSAGHDVIPYTRESDEIADFPLHRKAMLPARVVWSPEDHRKLRAAIRSASPDVVHIHNTFPLISPAAVHASVAEGIPVVASLHNFRLVCANGLLFRDGAPCELCVGRSPWSGIVHACYRNSRAATLPVAASLTTHRLLHTWGRGVSFFFALTAFAKSRFVASGLPASRIVIKPNTVRRPERPRTDAGDHVLFLGRLSPEKGLNVLLEAYSRVSLPLVIAGEGPERRALEARAAPLRGKVEFVGNRSNEECSELLRTARLLVVPSLLYEGFPVVVAEAYAHSVPVVAPAHGAFPEIVDDHRTGLLFRPGSARDLATVIDDLSDASASVAMGRAARQRYEDCYSPERNLDTLLRVYQQAAEAGRGGNEPCPVG